MDDTWASISRGWKLVDPKKSAQESIILEGTIEDEISIFLILRGKEIKKSYQMILIFSQDILSVPMIH